MATQTGRVFPRGLELQNNAGGKRPFFWEKNSQQMACGLGGSQVGLGMNILAIFENEVLYLKSCPMGEGGFGRRTMCLG